MRAVELCVLATLVGRAACAAAGSCDAFGEQCQGDNAVHLVQHKAMRMAPAQPHGQEAALLGVEAKTEAKSKAASETPNVFYDKDSFPGFVEHNCGRFTKAHWPQFSFWALQINKRLQYVEPQTAPGSYPAKGVFPSDTVKHWINQSSAMACGLEYDPRKGSHEKQPEVAEFYKKVMAMKGDEPFPSPPYTDSFPLVPNCWYWFRNQICYLIAWAEELYGEKAGDGELCWDKVDYPVSLDDPTLMDFKFIGGPAEQITPGAEDYTKCMDHPMDDVALRSICPSGHRAPPGREAQVEQCLRTLPTDYGHDPSIFPDIRSGKAITEEDRFWYALINATQGPEALEQVSGMSMEELEKALAEPYVPKSNS